MSDVVPDIPQEFWRRPVMAPTVVVHPAHPSSLKTAGSCAVCQTEFMSGSRFCYLCGATREVLSTAPPSAWARDFRFLRVLGLRNIKRGLGLPVPSLIGFCAGLGCVVAALSVGKVLSVQSAAEFQALQLLRVEWMLGSVAAFLAGILLKNAGSDD